MLDTLFSSITGLRFDKNSVTEVPFEFHVMTQLKELRFDEHLMRSPAMEIWVLLRTKAKNNKKKKCCSGCLLYWCDSTNTDAGGAAGVGDWAYYGVHAQILRVQVLSYVC